MRVVLAACHEREGIITDCPMSSTFLNIMCLIYATYTYTKTHFSKRVTAWAENTIGDMFGTILTACQ